jgi:surface protein
VTNMQSMFREACAFNQDLSNWNTAAVTKMHYMFYQASSFNHDLSNWNTGAVTDMAYMFRGASAFNQELCWSLKEGVDQTGSFDGSGGSFGCRFKPEDKAELQDAITAWIADPTAAAINYGPIKAWDTSLITDMSSLFGSRSSFNDDISNWNTEAVTGMKVFQQRPFQLEYSCRDKHGVYV